MLIRKGKKERINAPQFKKNTIREQTGGVDRMKKRERKKVRERDEQRDAPQS